MSVANATGINEHTLKCSFCGKAQFDIARLIAGPGVSICNECVDICAETIRQDTEAASGLDRAVNDCLRRALDELECAELLIANERHRVGVELSRSSCQSSLMAFELSRDGHVSYRELDKLMPALLFDDAELRALPGLDFAPLVKDVRGGESVSEDEAKIALNTARRLYEFVRTRVAR